MRIKRKAFESPLDLDKCRMLAGEREQSTSGYRLRVRAGYRRGSVKAVSFVNDGTVLYFDCGGGYMKLWVCSHPELYNKNVYPM